MRTTEQERIETYKKEEQENFDSEMIRKMAIKRYRNKENNHVTKDTRFNDRNSTRSSSTNNKQ